MKLNKLILAILLAVVSSCDSFLDIPDDVNIGLTKNEVFSDYRSTLGFLNTCYNNLQDNFFWNSQGLGRNSINAASDEAISLYIEGGGANLVGAVNNGEWLGRGGIPEVGFNYGTAGVQNRAIPNCYEALRVANIVIQEVNSGNIRGLSSSEKDLVIGQALFFRAWYYFQLIMRVGGMPPMDKVFSASDNYDGSPRLTYHQSQELIEKDLKEAIKLLPVSYSADQKGRVTKIAAMSLLSMSQLYDASPLMQNDINSTALKSYDTERCKTAAKSANEVLTAIANNQADGARLMSGSEYSSIFLTPTNVFVSDESLWYRNEVNNTGSGRTFRGIRSLNVPLRFSGGTGNDAASFNPPTQNIVDKYEVINPVTKKAFPIDHPSSGFDPQNPFVNRDPRFYNNIIVPGQKWGFNGTQQLYMELYDGGIDLLNISTNVNTNRRSGTGYACSKFWSNESNTFAGSPSFYKYNLNTVYIRVAQIYLDMAEAMNEAYGPTANPDNLLFSAVGALNKVRNRVGMPDVAPEFTTSKEVFRERIRNERAVELMHENHRWHDIRRWMIAQDLFADNNPIFGIKAKPQANHASVLDKSTLSFTYEKVRLTDQVRSFKMRNYWYPLDPDISARYPNIKQNPGW